MSHQTSPRPTEQVLIGAIAAIAIAASLATAAASIFAPPTPVKDAIQQCYVTCGLSGVESVTVAADGAATCVCESAP